MNAEETNQSATSLRCTLVVTTWHRPAALKTTLESLMPQSYRNMEIIVVCDGEDHDVRLLAENFKGARAVRWVFHPENLGLAAARNTGAREAAGDVVLFMDDDIVADRELVNAHMQHHTTAGEHRRIVVCGRIAEDPGRALTTYLNQRLQDARNRIFNESTEALLAPGAESLGDDIERGLWCGLNCSVRRSSFLHENGFNEYFRASDEEMELGQRLHLAGFEFIFEPCAQLVHMNTKDWTSFYLNSWHHKGALDVYRVFNLKQRNAQTQQLASMFHGYFMNRCAARAAWHFAGPLRSLANQLAMAANRTESHLLFGAWGRTAQAAAYWGGAKAAGCTLPRLKSVAGNSKCAVMLHSIAEPRSDDESRYYVSPRRFSRLMRYFQSAGFKTATTAQWLDNSASEKHALLTFDDGYDDLYEELLPLVIQHGYTPLIFLVADHIGASNVWDQRSGLRARNLLTLAQIREMQKYGVEFGSHTMTHPWLPGVSDAQLRNEVRDSKHRLEDLVGIEMTTFAYPFGGVDRRVRSAVADAEYKLAFTTEPGINWWNDPLFQRRVEVNDYTTVLDFACKLRSGRGCTETISMRLRNMEQELPTRILRNMAKGARLAGHEILHLFHTD